MEEQKAQMQSLIEEKSRLERALSVQTQTMDQGNLWQNEYALKRYNKLLEDLKIKKGEIDSTNQQLMKSEQDLKNIGAEESVQRLKEEFEKLHPNLTFNKEKFVELKLTTDDFNEALPGFNGNVLSMAEALAQAGKMALYFKNGVVSLNGAVNGVSLIGADAQKIVDGLQLDRKIANAKTPQTKAATETEKYIKSLSDQGKYNKTELGLIEKEYYANALARAKGGSGGSKGKSKTYYVKQYTDQVTQLQQRLADVNANLQDGGVSQYQELKKLTNDIAANGEKYAHFGAEGFANLKRLAGEIDSSQQKVAIRDLSENYKEQIEARQFELQLIGQSSEAVGGCFQGVDYAIWIMGFNTQPPEGGCSLLDFLPDLIGSFNTQPPEGGCWHRMGIMSFFRSFNTQPPEGGCRVRREEIPLQGGFNTQPPVGGCAHLVQCQAKP